MHPSFAPCPPLPRSYSPSPSPSPRWTCRKSGKSPSQRTRSRGTKRAALHDALQLYQSHFHPLLAAELAAEQAVARESAPSPPLAVHVRPRLFSSSVYYLVARALLPPAMQYAKGDVVDVEAVGESVQVTVLGGGAGGVAVAVPRGSSGSRILEGFSSGGVKVRLVGGVSGLGYERAVAALGGLSKAGKSDVAKLLVMSFAERMERGEGQSNELLKYSPERGGDETGVGDGGKWDSLAAEGFAGVAKSAVARVVRELPSMLNASQKRAVKSALSRKFTLIQGPPGTGKTVTAAHVVCGAVKLGVGRILVCAASNVAADNMLAKLVYEVPAGTKVVRIGRAAAIDEAFWDMSLESLLERDARLRRAREEADKGAVKGGDLREIEKEVAQRFLEGADIVVGTCVGFGREELQGVEFKFVVVDEATQATEPDVLVPLLVPIAKEIECQVVLVGDHHQLPPTTLSREKGNAHNLGLDTSLFLRLWQGGVGCQLLDVQYRMHPQISKFPAAHFYSSRLRDGVRAQDRPLPALFKDKSVMARKLKGRVLFVDVRQGGEAKEATTADNGLTSYSLCNQAEVDQVIHLVQLLLGSKDRRHNEDAFTASDIGIISPYAAQVKLLKNQLAKIGGTGLEVATVDGFQGREKNVIILSAVRSNKRGEVGFLNDWRRLNVSMTRARTLLVLVGNRETLYSNIHWRLWLQWIQRDGVAFNCDEKLSIQSTEASS